MIVTKEMTTMRRQFSDEHFARTVFVLAAIVFSVYGISRVDTYLANAYDLGIFDQAVRHYAHFEAPIVTLKGDGYNIWADHFHPIIAVWAPLYWIWDNIRVLIIGQAIVVAATVFPLWRFVSRHVSRPVWAKFFVILTMLGWPIQCLIDFDVHEIAFAIPLLAWIIDALDRRDDRTLLVCSALLLLVREDMGVIVCVVGILRFFIRHRYLDAGRENHGDLDAGRVQSELARSAEAKEEVEAHSAEHGSSVAACQSIKIPKSNNQRWIISLALVIVGISVFILTTTVVIPHFSGGEYQYWDYADLGATPHDALIFMVTKPWKVLWMLVAPVTKTWTWLALLVPLAFLPLRSPYSFMALPIMAERMLASREHLWTLHFHYNSPVWIIACMATIDAISRLPHGVAAKPYAAVSGTTLGLGRTNEPVPRSARVGVRQWSRDKGGLIGVVSILMAICLIVGSATTEIFPLRRMLTGAAFTLTPEARSREQVVDWLPADTCVAADNLVAGQLTHSHRITVPGISEHRQDFYVLDFSQPEPAVTPVMWTTQEAYDHAIGLRFSEAYRAGTITVLQAPDYNGPNAVECGPDSP